MKTLRALLFLVLVTAPIAASRAQRPGDQEKEELDRAHAALDRVYQRLLGALSPDEQSLLKETERAWIKWRDLEADLGAKLATAGGSARRTAFYEASLQMVQQRQKTLQGYLQDATSR